MPGARFRGSNRQRLLRWSTVARSRWPKGRSALSAVPNVLRGGGDRAAQVQQAMHTTLANLKREGETTIADARSRLPEIGD